MFVRDGDPPGARLLFYIPSSSCLLVSGNLDQMVWFVLAVHVLTSMAIGCKLHTKTEVIEPAAQAGINIKAAPAPHQSKVGYALAARKFLLVSESLAGR